METIPVWFKILALGFAWIAVGIPIAFIAGMPFDQGASMSRHTPEPGSSADAERMKKMGRAGIAGLVAFIAWGIFLLFVGFGIIK